MSERFKVLQGSQSAHCCFDATVVDTSKPVIINGRHYADIYGQLQFEPVCECFSDDDAQTIARALNGQGSSVALGCGGS